MAKRNSKTAAQQCRYYEVDNIFEYMVETYINGNFSTFWKFRRKVTPLRSYESDPLCLSLKKVDSKSTS